MNQHEAIAELYFSSPILLIKNSDFVDQVSIVAEEYLNEVKKDRKLDDIFPLYQGDSMIQDSRVRPLAEFIAQLAWECLNGQGYDMDNFKTQVTEVWAQQHFKGSGHGEHIHPFGSIMTGFYILKAPEGCSKIVLHDPRPGKKQISLPERDANTVTYCSSIINYTPEVGQLYLINSYVPHEISRNPAEQPFEFVHFNVGVIYDPVQSNPTSCVHNAEII